MFCKHVMLQSGALSKAHVADFTLVRPFSGMAQLMTRELANVSKSTMANLALARLPTEMRVLMTREMRGPLKSFAAHLAHVRFLLRMGNAVPLEVGEILEYPKAHRALVDLSGCHRR